jgi:hypothetical protein
MSLAPLEQRPTHKALPLLRSEISRITHRRLYRVLAALLLAAIAVISVIAFFAHNDNRAAATEEQIQTQFDRMAQGWERCVGDVPANRVEQFCGQQPALEDIDPYGFGRDERYLAYEVLPLALIGAAIAAAGVGFLVGASSGGAEWSSRSMTLQLLYEPRRLRLLIIKWLGLLVSVMGLAAVAMALTLALGAITASMRGTWDERYAVVDEMQDHFWGTMAVIGLRGLLLAAVASTIGYAIAMLVRNTGASLGVAFVYFAVVENGVRFVLFKYGSEPFMLSTNSIASLFPGGVDVPGAEKPNGSSTNVELTNLRATMTMVGYTALLCIPAAWSFTRRDVG